MSTTSMRRGETGDAGQDSRARDMIDDLGPLLALPFSGGVWLRNIPIVAGTNVINHKLGRVPSGWHPTRVRGADPQLVELPGGDERVILLSGVAVATVDLWVFP